MRPLVKLINTSFNFGHYAIESATEGNTMAKNKVGVPAGETETQKLVRLATKRVNKAIVQIRLIGNLGTYKPTDQQRSMIVKAIDEEVTAMKRNIQSAVKTEEGPFKLA